MYFEWLAQDDAADKIIIEHLFIWLQSPSSFYFTTLDSVVVVKHLSLLQDGRGLAFSVKPHQCIITRVVSGENSWKSEPKNLKIHSFLENDINVN